MIRLGIALIMSAAFANHFWVQFAEYMANSELYSHNMALQTMAQSAATELGSAAVIPAIFLLLCVGAALIGTQALFKLFDYVWRGHPSTTFAERSSKFPRHPMQND